MKAKKVVAGLLVSVMAVSVTACGKYPANSSVRNKAEEYMAGEDCTEISSSKEDGVIVITYESDERDLEFHVYGYRTKKIWELTTADGFGDITTPTYGTDYYEQITELYYDDIADVLDEMSAASTDENRHRFDVRFDDPSDVDAIVEILVRANAIYAQELEYHDAEWLGEHEFCTVVFNYISPNSTDGRHYAFTHIDGLSTAEDYEEELNRVIDYVDGN